MTSRKKKKAQNRTAPTGAEDPNSYILTAPFIAVVGLYLLGRALPASISWGFGYWQYFSWNIAALSLGAAVILIFPPVRRGLAQAIEPAVNAVRKMFGFVPRPIGIAVVSVLTVIVLYYLRSRTLVYGDGFAVLDHATGDDAPVLIDQHYLQVLAIYFHRYSYLLLSKFVSMSPAEIFGLVNAVGGMFGFWGLYRISRLITANTASRAFIFLGAATSGAVILFFGHIENYTWALAFSLWTLSYAIGYHKNQKGMTGLILFSVLAVLFHAISVPVAVVAFVAVFLKNSPRGTSAWGISLTRINMAFVVGSVALAFAFHMKKQGILVPLWPVDGNPYAVISPEHLIDVLNQMALVAPLAVALILFGMLYERRRVAATGEEDAVLGTAALLFFLASFWIDPNIGAVRDWDLLSYYGLPLTLWALLRFTKYFAQRRVSPGWVMAASVLIVIGIGPNLYEKNNPELAIDRLDKIIRDDVHYQPSYEWGNRCVAWVAILQQGMGRHDLAVEYLKRGLELAPQSYSGFLNLASIYYQKGELDSCLVYTKRAQAAKPDDPQITAMVYDLQRRMPWLDSAVTESETAVRLDSNNVEALTQHAYALDDRGRSREALTYFKRAYELAPGRYESIVNLGFCFAAVDMIDSAQYYVSKAYPMAPRDNKPILCCCLIAAAIDLNRRQEAVGYLNELERIAPNSPKLIVFKARIENMAP